MASVKKNTVVVTCPHCGQKQSEPRTGYSTVCRQCHQHFRLAEALQPAPKRLKPEIQKKRVACFQCGAELEVPLAAESTMCKGCSSHVDLTDYHVSHTVSKNFRTHGRLVIEKKGCVQNTESLVGDAVIKGRVIGRIVARRTLEIHSTAIIKGSFDTGRLIIPAGHHFQWPETLRLGGAEIAGELVAKLSTAGTVLLKSTGRFFGEVEAGNLVVEAGAVFVGAAKVGRGL